MANADSVRCLLGSKRDSQRRAGKFKRIEVSYLYGDETRVDYYTVLEFEISDVYYDKSGSLKEGGERVLYILSSYFSSKNAVTFTSEGDYILILRPSRVGIRISTALKTSPIITLYIRS